MKVALVCVAKNEDLYIEEWIKYHIKIGFDKIFVYKNDWDYDNTFENVVFIEKNGKEKQIESYNDFIKKNNSSYDWALFIDVDEFLVLKQHNNVKDFLLCYNEFNSIGINWVFFGDNGQTKNNNFNVLSRFTKRQQDVDKHIKTFVKLNKKPIMSVHNSNLEWVDTNKIKNKGPFNKTPIDNIAQINHFFCKTYDEFVDKIDRGRADNGKKRNINDFYNHNHNHIEDLTAYNFFYDNNNLLNT
jgi:hypothetical protein